MSMLLLADTAVIVLPLFALGMIAAGLRAAMASSVPGETPRETAEDDSAATRHGLSLLVDQLPAYLWTADTRLRFGSAGGRGLQILGVSAEDLVGRPVGNLGDGKEAAEQNLELHRRALAGETVRFETRLRGQAIEGAIGPIRSRDGRAAGVAGVAVNVTAKENATELASVNQRMLQDILDRAPASIFIRDLEGRLTFVNRNWETVCGRSRQEALGTRIGELFPPELAQIYERNFRSGIARGKSFTAMEKVVTGGEARTYMSVRFPLRSSDGSIYAVCGISVDRTEHVRLQLELRKRQTLLDAAQEMAQLASWEMNLRTGKRYWSPQFYALLGREPEAEGRDTPAFTPDLLFAHVLDEDRDRARQVVTDALVADSQYRVQYRVRRADGSVIWLMAVGSIERDSEGTPVRLFGFVQDVTERVSTKQEISTLHDRLEERVRHRSHRLEVAVKELSSFSYAVSHDLRQPLRAIAGYLSILEEEVGPSLGEEARGYVTRVQAAARRMDSIIDDLLALSRVSHAAIERVTLDVTAMARDVASEVGAADPARNVVWTIQEGMTAVADRGLVRIVLQNLFGNAFKFSRSREQACIEMGCTEENGEGVFFVRDNGAGFETAHAQRLFQPFQRLHDTAKFEGTGIGLATVARVVRRHGGWIRAEAVPDEGATFKFTFPGKAY